jgi:hypothetical protein
MEYNVERKEIILNRELSELDKFVFDFIRILEKYVDYVIISGYISILLGRSRATEDVDLFLKKIDKSVFSKLYEELDQSGFWCLNADSSESSLDYLERGYAIRFAKKNQAIPNFEIKFPKRKLDLGTFEDFLIVKTKGWDLKISSLERQIAFKETYLGTEKDLEDAEHIRVLFKDKLNKDRIIELIKEIEVIKRNE